ncbi:MAG: hypothetical protein V4681_03020 [Patescibacteria group bacterium]
MYARAYALPTPLFWVFRDADDDRIERLRFHIEQGDYFPFLATIVGMLRETASSCEAVVPEAGAQSTFAEDVRKDLIYLHENYTIAPKQEPTSFSKQKVTRFKGEG